MNTIRDICRKSLMSLLSPLVKFCLRHAIKQRDVVEILKLNFIKAASDELERLGLPVTPSKISVMTGIQRRDVNRLLVSASTESSDRDLVSRVIGLWESGKRYRDRSGRVRVLGFSGREGDFAELVAQVSTDLNPYTVAFELERIGAVQSVEGGLKLIRAGYEPGDNVAESLALLAEDSELLHEAVNENIFEPKTLKNIHVKTEFDNIPVRFENEVRAWFLEQGGELHERARQYLSALDRDLNPEIGARYPDEPAVKAVIGTVSLTIVKN